jgi:DNA (cytosine-5)-methyltransferase 1
MKILNLYAGIGGNRKLWGDEHEVTSVESEQYIADAYSLLYPNDTVIVGDAHQYLLDHHKEFDFIWSSPPCPSHSVTNSFLYAQGVIRYPDMKLYEEIILLKHRFKGKWVVENVKSYYDPLIKPVLIDRHYFWSNFAIEPMEIKRDFNVAQARASTRIKGEDYGKSLEEFHGIKLEGKVKNYRKLLRNAVYPPLGKHILDSLSEPSKEE